MALILGVRPGTNFYIGDEPVHVVLFEGHSRAVLRFRSCEVEVVDTKATELMKGVYISCGTPKIAREGGVVLPRLVIDAPRNLVILREELYGKPRPDHGRSKYPRCPRARVPDSA